MNNQACMVFTIFKLRSHYRRKCRTDFFSAATKLTTMSHVIAQYLPS
jgi:hypothetical protein